jgi:crotonobetainyl-CoA:carnitine CoA-transferase CaiB-like acyl-CoA transferase
MDTNQTTESLLGGVAVIDLADETGWFCSKLMAGLGAQVIRIEQPVKNIGVSGMSAETDADAIQRHASYAYNNAGKLGITLNLNSIEGRQIFRRLAAADDIVETFQPGYLTTLEIDYVNLSKSHPEIIMTSITGFGLTGLRAGYKSCDIVASAEGGQMYVCGDPEASPLMPYGQQPYYTASLSAAIGTLLALRSRRITGKGQHIDISLQETTSAAVEHVLFRYFHEGIVSRRQGGMHWNNAACTFPCSDGFMFITFNREWEMLVDLLDAEGLAADLKSEEWNDEEYRRANVKHIVDVISAWTLSHTTAELFELGQLMRLTWAPVCKPGDVISNPQMKARRFFSPLTSSVNQILDTIPNLPYVFNTIPRQASHQAPSPGEHNRLVFVEKLGLSPVELESLQKEGII